MSDEDPVRLCLRNTFGHPTFRSREQEKAIRAIVSKDERDVFVSMPTGSGKSLVYQLPGVLLPKGRVSIVVSPLIALIKDQMEGLQRKRIRSESLNSKLAESERKRILIDLNSKSPETRFLYVTPEQCATSTFRSLLEKLVRFQVAGLFIVDEAHCVSQWGHDFRPDYLKLGSLRSILGKTRVIALTATASKTVASDVFKQLKFRKNPLIYKLPCFRSNLFYEVSFKESIALEYEDLKDFAVKSLGDNWESNRGRTSSCGIVYCRTRDGTLEIAEQLTKRGVPTLAYHAGLKDSQRSGVQEAWADGKVPVIAATISFGMGVDKASVRFVAHWSAPQSVAGYYQESGRAGRDGKPSFCRIYYSRHERDTIGFILKQDIAKAKTERRKEVSKSSFKAFEAMIKYCEGLICRHLTFSRYFNDEILPVCNKKCDVCENLRLAEKKLEAFQANALRNATFRGAPTKSADPSELYEGGREGNKRSFESHNSDDESESFESSEKRAKKARESLIKREFKNRKKNGFQAKRNQDDEKSLCFSKVRGAQFTKTKIAGLEVRSRESYLGLLETNIRSNYDTAIKYGSIKEEDRKLTNEDILNIAVDEEYKIFTSNKVVTMYRRGMAFLMAAVKKETDAWNPHSCIIEYDRSVSQSLSTMAAEIETKRKEKEEASTFKNEPPPSEKSKSERRGFNLKRDPLTQTGITKFFSKPQNVEVKAKNKWKALGLDDDDENEEKEQLRDKETSSSTLNFYTDTLEASKCESPSSSDSPSILSEASLDHKDSSLHSEEVDVTPSTAQCNKVSPLYEKPKSPEISFEEKLKREFDAISTVPTPYSPTQEVNPETVFKLEETISKLQKQMAESADSVNWELKMKEERPEGLDNSQSDVVEIKKDYEPSQTSAPRKNSRGNRPKIKVKVEDLSKISKGNKFKTSLSSSSSNSKAEKAQKIEAANQIVKVLVPYFKSGKIVSKEVFKFAAREMTHVLLDVKVKPNTYSNYISKFFKRHCIIHSIEDARTKISHFKSKISY